MDIHILIETEFEKGASDDLTANEDRGRNAATTLFLDGAHIRCRPEYQKRHLDVFVGKTEGSKRSRRFGMVREGANSPLTSIRKELTEAGWRPGAPLTVLTDGEPALPNLVTLTIGQSFTHILDWWHISMRIRHVEMAVKGLVRTEGFTGIPIVVERPAERLRWSVWHGRSRVAVTQIMWLMVDRARLGSTETMAFREAVKRVLSRCKALFSYLSNNQGALVDYGSRYRQGLPISTSRAEGCVNDIANMRMGKKRRMRWSPRVAHHVATTRAAVLDGRLTISHRRMAA